MKTHLSCSCSFLLFAANRFVRSQDRSGLDSFALGNYNNKKNIHNALFITQFVRRHTVQSIARAQRIAFAYGFDGAMNDDR